MISKNERTIIEAIKSAGRIRLVIESDSDRSEIAFTPSKLLSHDIALAVQSHYNRINTKKQ